ncbi:MAG: S41 family peptidase [Planctomycetota bacterium]|nr:S41 family peptidase [Planctomycetota bacterium]
MKPSNSKKERLAVFHETLWMLEHGFYDEDLHGLDMARIRDSYEPLVKRCVNDAQFRRVMSEILAVFNASHMSIGSKPGEDMVGVVRDNSPHIGFMFDPALADNGVLRITHLVENTPAAAENSGLKVGDYVLSIEGTKIAPGVNPHKLVRNKLGAELKLEVAYSPDAEETRTVYLPTVNLQVFYSRMIAEWEEDNRRYVAEKSGGKFGYVCLRSMMDPDYAKFKKDISRFLANYEGVVLDFRYNSGGRIAHQIAEVLDDSPWLYSGMRGGRWVPEDVHRDFSVQKAVVGLFNERSFSNAEMMLAAFRIKKL